MDAGHSSWVDGTARSLVRTGYGVIKDYVALPELARLVRLTALLTLGSPPAATAADITVDGMRLVFAEDFHTLDVSAKGPATRWTAHTPWAGDFGDAAFSDPQPGFPFTLSPEGLRIEARRDPAGRWQSGLLSSTSPDGAGFAMQYGYFEMSAKLPAGGGVWPAFWLDSQPAPGSGDPSVEVDVIEQYGRFPAAYNSTLTVWSPTEKGKGDAHMKINAIPAGLLSAGFHTFGVKVDPRWTIFYRDRMETWRVATPPQHRHRFTILVDLGLGGGWPIEATPNPSIMTISYIRAYAED